MGLYEAWMDMPLWYRRMATIGFWTVTGFCLGLLAGIKP